ncbi:NfeD family protein [Arcanobacterium hippocoleae]
MMLALGAFSTAIVAAFSTSLTLQIITFAVVAVVALLFVRPWARNHINAGTGKESNVYAMTGRNAIALSEITENSGRVKIGGEVWSARTKNDQIIPAGAEVTVLEIEGAHAVVYEVNV